MKKYIYFIIAFTSLFASCDVLDTEPLDTYNELVVWKDRGLAENVLKRNILECFKRLILFR